MAKVLLVEDDNNLREIYQARLMAEGYEIVAAQNGEEALVSAKQNKPDLIISDVMMPRISGFEMLDILRNTDELKNTKVIMLTALGQAEDQARADNLGADKYLVKSQVTLEDIVNAAKELLGEAGAIVETPSPAETENGAPPAPEPAPPQPAVDSTPLPADPPATIPAPLTAAPLVNEAAEAEAAPSVVEPVVPASIVPQPNTTVVVPPAPANPTPPTVTVVALPSEPAAEPTTQVPTDTVQPAEATTPPEELVESSTPPAAEPSTVAPEPSPESSATPPSEPAAQASVTDSAPQSIEAEEAALQAQIEGYAKQTPEAPLEAAPPAPDADAVSNEEALASAVEQLNGKDVVPETVTPTEEVTPAPPPVEASAESDDSDSATVAHKKVIRPISGDLNPGPNLDELLAKEEATHETPPVAPIINGAPGQAPTEHPPAKPGQSFDPNSISL